MTSDQVIVIQGVVSVAAAIVLGLCAQHWRMKAENLADHLLSAHEWVDEVIEALENRDVEAGNARLDHLTSVRPGGGDAGILDG